MEEAKAEWAEKVAALKNSAEEEANVLKKISDAILVSKRMCASPPPSDILVLYS